MPKKKMLFAIVLFPVACAPVNIRKSFISISQCAIGPSRSITSFSIASSRHVAVKTKLVSNLFLTQPILPYIFQNSINFGIFGIIICITQLILLYYSCIFHVYPSGKMFVVVQAPSICYPLNQIKQIWNPTDMRGLPICQVQQRIFLRSQVHGHLREILLKGV